MNDAMSIVLVGHVCIDHNVSEKSSYTRWGSGLMYMAHYAQAHLQTKPVLLAPYGSDFAPYSQDVTLLSEEQSTPTLIYENHTNNRIRTQRCEHANFANPVKLNSAIKASLSSADILVVAPLLPNFSASYVIELLAHKKAGGLSVLLPQGYFRSITSDGLVLPRKFEEAADIIPLFDMVIFSEEDTSTAIELAKQWSKQSRGVIIVTQGLLGASGIAQGSVESVSTQTIPVNQIVDSVGAGDIFSIAAMHDYYQNKDLRKAMIAGNSAARARLLQGIEVN